MPHLSLRSQLLLMRRLARYLATEQNQEDDGQKAGRRQGSSSHKSALINIRIWVCQNDQRLTEGYGVGGICDLLGVNGVHRGELMEQRDVIGRAISVVAYTFAVEDSAMSLSGKRPAELKGGPLYQALWERSKQAQVEKGDNHAGTRN